MGKLSLMAESIRLPGIAGQQVIVKAGAMISKYLMRITIISLSTGGFMEREKESMNWILSELRVKGRPH